ncbi:MAG: RsmD family RNA methyltransferase [Chitinispirillaceae bacterium]|jgi:16S rRNA (guanine966-N2)-methyltransferase|nr:RsmD family RNA methyltransferase [Chitinispirillaceae bacterium]
MNLRIVAGSLKGRVISCRDSVLPFRPTLGRMRTSIADMMQPRCMGATAADLCAGSGAMGFELLSRGAARVDFVEKNRQAAGIIRSHAQKFGVTAQCRILEQDAESFIQGSGDFYDIIFFDPPYADLALSALVPLLTNRLADDGVVLFQRAAAAVSENALVLPFQTKTFGDTVIELYRREKE